MELPPDGLPEYKEVTGKTAARQKKKPGPGSFPLDIFIYLAKLDT